MKYEKTRNEFSFCSHACCVATEDYRLACRTRRMNNFINILLTLIPVWIGNCIQYKVREEITYIFLNFIGTVAEVWQWKVNFIPHLTGYVITYPCGIKVNPFGKMGPLLARSRYVRHGWVTTSLMIILNVFISLYSTALFHVVTGGLFDAKPLTARVAPPGIGSCEAALCWEIEFMLGLGVWIVHLWNAI